MQINNMWENSIIKPSVIRGVVLASGKTVCGKFIFIHVPLTGKLSVKPLIYYYKCAVTADE